MARRSVLCGGRANKLIVIVIVVTTATPGKIF